MALTLNVDGITGIDESLGNQVVAGAKHDINVGDLSAEAVAAFNAALSGYSLDVGDAIELAGDPTDGTDGNDVQVSGDMITGLSLTDENGDLYDGTYDSGLMTLAGNSIFLLSASDDNVVLGIEATTGDVVFAIYLQEVSESGTIVGGDFWVALFEPLKHPQGGDGNADDLVDLTSKLFVSAEQVINFSFAGAPSGQNEFMAFQSGNVVIVASGEANGDTVNSGQGANLPDNSDKTALGTNSQSIKAGDLLNFNFTTGFNPDYVVPGLTPTEASSQANILFTGVFNTTGAAFNMVKVTGGGASTTPLVHLSAWTTEVETGMDFISGHADDVMVAITKVFVNGVDVTNDASMVTDNLDGTFTVIGATENARIKVETDDPFSRLAIKNAGDDQVVFSVQAFSLESTSDVQAEAGSKIDFYDDGPGEGTQDVLLDLWEDALTGGNPDGDSETEVAVATGNLSANFDPGTDSEGFTFGAISTVGTTLNSDNGLVFDVTVDKDFDATVDGVFYDDEITLSIGSTDHFQILVNTDGDIRIELLNAIDHITATDDEDTDHIDLGDLFEAFDGDDDRLTFAPSAVQATIEDDAPVFDISLGSGLLQTDDGALTGGNAGGTATDTEGAGSLFTIVTSSPGADGDGGTVWELELSAATVATTLVDTATGEAVELSLNGLGDVEGRTGTSGDLVFTLSVNTGTGAVTLTQARAVMHGTGETAAAYDDDTTGLGLGAGDYINLRGTLSDAESPADEATDAINIAPNISFTDDGPVFDLTDLGGTLQTDDADLAGGTDTDTEGVGSLFSVASELPGADGDGGTVYTLELGANTVTNLVDTATGQTVVLSLNAGVVEGRTQGSNLLVFTLAVNSGTGAVTQTQYRAVEHGTADTASPYNGDTTGLGVADAVYLRGTLSDGETAADSATDAIDISDSVSFTDDGPAIAVEDSNAPVPATYATGAQGTWTDSAGADGFASLGVELVSYQIDALGTVTVNAALGDGGDADPYSFAGSITDDFNGDGTDETVNFTLEFDPDLDTYDLQVTTPPNTTTTISTADGQLDAGGPTPVRTLSIGDDDIVFAAVNATAASDDIKDYLNSFEATWESDADFLSAAQMNVSTSGIGNGNNNFEGNATHGVDGTTTQGGAIDESFVVDPTGFVVSSVKVYIDNSVGGYDNPPEDLWYRIYYADGTVSGQIEVLEGVLSPEAGGQESFVIGDADGPNNIDAVQLFMGQGTIKIPVIEFTASQEFDPQPLTLNFQATETDGDTDSATDGFMVDLDVA